MLPEHNGILTDVYFHKEENSSNLVEIAKVDPPCNNVNWIGSAKCLQSKCVPEHRC